MANPIIPDFEQDDGVGNERVDVFIGEKRMGKGRLEAFSDGVITIMVLELKVPHGATFDALLPLLPVLGSYVLSFIYVGIYWNKLQYANNPSLWNCFAHGN